MLKSVMLVLLGLACIATKAEGADTATSNIDATIAQVVRARDYTAQFVVLAKKSFKAGSPEYNQAFKLYAAAYSDYGAWDAYLASALASGRVKDKKPLPNDSHYDDLSSTATKSATVFVSYVDTNTQGASKAVVAILSSLADLGLKLWTGISAKKAQDRAALSKRFSDATVWQTWEQITDGSSPNVAPSKTDSKPTDNSTPKTTSSPGPDSTPKAKPPK